MSLIGPFILGEFITSVGFLLRPMRVITCLLPLTYGHFQKEVYLEACSSPFVVVHSCNLSPWETEEGRSRDQDWLGLFIYSETLFQITKRKKKNNTIKSHPPIECKKSSQSQESLYREEGTEFFPSSPQSSECPHSERGQRGGKIVLLLLFKELVHIGRGLHLCQEQQTGFIWSANAQRL